MLPERKGWGTVVAGSSMPVPNTGEPRTRPGGTVTTSDAQEDADDRPGSVTNTFTGDTNTAVQVGQMGRWAT